MCTEKNVFERNPAKTVFLFVFFVFLFVDLIAGLFLIPKSYEYYNTYRTSHNYYHHGFKPNQIAPAKDFDREYSFYTNSLGLRDNSVREILTKSRKKRILFIGDSFTEGVGVAYEESFVGIIQQSVDTSKIELLNAGVVSYSPKLYYLKTKYLIEIEKIHFDQLYVFIDVSDPMDEIKYSDYEIGENPEVLYIPSDFELIKNFFKRISFTYYSLAQIHHRNDLHPLLINHLYEAKVKNYPWKDPFKERATWTSDSIVLRKWGNKGLKLAKENMENLVRLCNNSSITMKIIVYPYPHHILNERDNCLQVDFWKKFCLDHQIEFIDLFPLFIQNKDPENIIRGNFFAEDVHWNINGHYLVASEIIKYMNQ